jgi:hypothetical protein
MAGYVAGFFAGFIAARIIPDIKISTGDRHNLLNLSGYESKLFHELFWNSNRKYSVQDGVRDALLLSHELEKCIRDKSSDDKSTTSDVVVDGCVKRISSEYLKLRELERNDKD